MHNKNEGAHIEGIVASTKCGVHSASEGSPCWMVWIGTIQKFGPAVCGRRIKKAGFDGKIDPKSLSRFSVDKSKAPKGRPQKTYSK